MKLEVWIGNLAKMNTGEHVGEWVTLPISPDEQEALFIRLGLGYYDSNDNFIVPGDYIIADYKADFDAYKAFGSYPSLDELNFAAEKLAEWELDQFLAANELMPDVNDLLKTDPTENWYFREDVKTPEELGYMDLIDHGVIIPEELEGYFDYQAYGEDLEYEPDTMLTKHGYIRYYSN